MRLAIGPEGVYLYGIYTIEEMRRKGIYDAIQEEFFRYCQERNMKRVYTMIEKDNLIMKEAFLKRGFGSSPTYTMSDIITRESAMCMITSQGK